MRAANPSPCGTDRNSCRDVSKRQRFAAVLLPLFLPLSLSGCGTAPVGDDAAIVRATLALMATGRSADRPLCVDNRPRTQPLAIFRTMRINSEPDEHPWREPEPLRAEPKVSGRDLFEDATGRDRLRIREPDDAAEPLPREEQARLDARARALSVDDQSTGYVLSQDMAPPGLAVRWWLLNRLRGCERTMVLSRVVHGADTGFITVTLDHWGTTYAVERAGTDWRVTAQWDSWLY